jgi:Predicted periplasmic ligand-binding sensor domain
MQPLTEIAKSWLVLVFLGLASLSGAADFQPSLQHFKQEIATQFSTNSGLPAGPVQLLQLSAEGSPKVFISGKWYEYQSDKWILKPELTSATPELFLFPGSSNQVRQASIPWREVRQLLTAGDVDYLLTSNKVFTFNNRQLSSLDWTNDGALNQLAIIPRNLTPQTVYLATSVGLFIREGSNWQPVRAQDVSGRDWGTANITGLAIDSKGQLWFGCRAGAVCKQSGGKWRFYEGKDGLPWNEFTCMAAGPDGTVWLGTTRGAVKFDGSEWHYRQGRRWLPNDRVTQVALDSQGKAWFGTEAGVGSIGHVPMTLAEKAAFYESEIERYIKRTPYGYVAEAYLEKPADKSSAHPYDSDNDGLWTAMYGAGECFAFAATREQKALDRARKAFEALRFLQKVTQGGKPAPPKGFVARTIRPIDWPDPNIGRLEADRRDQAGDALWKVYEPRWPRSADGKWFWKSDTSSDELDGHYFFYPLYYEFCADTDAERERVREVVRDLTDHLIEHDFALVDIDGKPTRWGVYSPSQLNHNPRWWQERGINSMSILCYLAIAEYITGDAKYAAASRELIDQHSYAANVTNPKVQHGPGSGNQSDDEMAFMCYYGLLRYSKDVALKNIIRYALLHYWANEAPEMNPFFDFVCAAHNLGATVPSNWGKIAVSPWSGWLEDSMATLYGFPLDRLSWAQLNSHRLDLVRLGLVSSKDLPETFPRGSRGYRVNGKVLPVENRQFSHWNTDPWALDYRGNGNELGAGTVFLLPYYMGLYHGFIEKPTSTQTRSAK